MRGRDSLVHPHRGVGMHHLNILGLAMLLCSCASIPTATGGAAQPAVAPAGFWEHWGDGQAELNGYQIQQPRYGEIRTGEGVSVFVTETFTHAQRLKSDGGHSDEYPVIKFNDVRDFQTGIYDYNAMTSAFVRLDGADALGLPVKVSFSMQEWCGHVWDQILVDQSRWSRVGHSYFDGEGDASTSGDLPNGAVFADALPIYVRGLAGELIAPGAQRSLTLFPRLMAARLTHRPAQPVQATLSRSKAPATVTVPAGSFEVDLFTVAISGGTTTTYAVERASPYRLVRWEVDNGERGELTGTTRLKYWQTVREGDEALRQQLGLQAKPPQTGTTQPP